MKTNNLSQDLKKHFENTSSNQIIKEWEKSKHLDGVGPTIEEFLNYSNKLHEVQPKRNH